MSNDRKMGFGFLLAAGLFLWNPVIGVRDVLPDAIGYLLLCLGISRLADLNDDICEAQKAFRAMIWIGFGQIIAELLADVVMRRIPESLKREQPVLVLLFAFVFLVLQWYFIIPAWRKLFKGLSSLAEFHGGTAVLHEKKGKTLCEKMAKASVRFVILSSLCTFLPELTALTLYDQGTPEPTGLFRLTEFLSPGWGADHAGSFNWYSYISLLRGTAFLISAVVGLIWLIRYLRFFYTAMKDSEWQQSLSKKYRTEILPDTGLLLNRRVGAAFAFFRVGIVFLINLSLSYYECLPDWVSVLLFACGWLMLGSLLEQGRPFLLCGAILGVVGIFGTIWNARYLRDYIPEDARYLPEAYARYVPVQALGIAETLLMLLFVVLLVRMLTRMADRHVAVDYGKNISGLSIDATERVRRMLKQKAIPMYIFLVLSSVGKIVQICFQHMFGWIWILQFILSFAAVLMFSAFLSALSEQISDTYPVKGVHKS